MSRLAKVLLATSVFVVVGFLGGGMVGAVVLWCFALAIASWPGELRVAWAARPSQRRQIPTEDLRVGWRP